jgi:predicted nucleotidyltransferase component of viral defense system
MSPIELTRKQVTAIAEEYSFTATNVEKVIRLCSILDDLSTMESFMGKLALKGGTAINLVLIPGLPRLSVDLDLDLAIDCSKEEMLLLRRQLDESLSAYCIEQGYTLDKRENYSLCSYELLYDTVNGSRDKIKFDINYLARCHVFDPMVSSISHPFFKDIHIKVFHLQAVEIFGSKMGAFFERTKPRDLYDLYSLSQSGLMVSGEERNFLRKCAVFYSTIGNDSQENWLGRDIDQLVQMSFSKIRSQLLPMLRIKAGAYPKAKIEGAVVDFVKVVMQLDENDKDFVEKFQFGEYRPELLFGTQMKHLEHHPVALATLSKMKK